MDRNTLEILLLQFRIDISGKHEARCFQKYGKLGINQLAPYDAMTMPVATQICDGYDAVILGGSNINRVSAGEPKNLDAILNVVRYCYDHDIPTYGSCFGSHLIAQALGGRVEYAPDRKELETIDIHLYPEAKNDPLFQEMPVQFKANAGRTDDIVELPPDAIPLAYSDNVKYHAFRIKGKPMYAVQFHAELGQEEQRMSMMYAFRYASYFDSEEELKERQDAIGETPIASSLISRFIDEIVMPRA
ncbi:MAG: type 1 glutamine amidotransferase [Candidatus Kerfeldbacteria bacterium]